MKKFIPYRIYKAYYENLCYDGILRRGEYDAAAKAIAVEGDDCIMALLDAATQQTDLYPTNRMVESIVYSLPTAEATLAAAAPTREELVAAILYDIDSDDPISSPARAYRRQAIAVRDMLPDSWRGRTLAELREQQEAASAQAEAEMEAQYDPLARCWRRYDPESDLWIECSEKEAAPAATGMADAHTYFHDGVFVAVCPDCGEEYKAALFLWESVNDECCGYECRTCGTRYVLNY